MRAWMVGLISMGLAAVVPLQARDIAPPDGPFAVGTIAWHLVDSSRNDPLSDATFREVMVRVWYPANGKHQPTQMRCASDLVGVHSNPDLSVADARPFPVVFLAPGRGMAACMYSSMAESLASVGYVVVGVDSPHSGRVHYPSGRVVPPSPAFKPPRELFQGSYEKVDAFFQPAAQAGGQDILFVLEHLESLHHDDPDGRFTGRLALGRIGLFAHSLGGRIAGAAAALDSRFVALMAMEGVPPRQPRNQGMDAAVAMLLSQQIYPYAIDNVRELVPNRRNDVFVITLQDFGHNDVSDLPLREGNATAAQRLQLGNRLARAFFDRYLRHSNIDFADSHQWPDSVQFERFAQP